MSKPPGKTYRMCEEAFEAYRKGEEVWIMCFHKQVDYIRNILTHLSRSRYGACSAWRGIHIGPYPNWWRLPVHESRHEAWLKGKRVFEDHHYAEERAKAEVRAALSRYK